MQPSPNGYKARIESFLASDDAVNDLRAFLNENNMSLPHKLHPIFNHMMGTTVTEGCQKRLEVEKVAAILFDKMKPDWINLASCVQEHLSESGAMPDKVGSFFSSAAALGQFLRARASYATLLFANLIEAKWLSTSAADGADGQEWDAAKISAAFASIDERINLIDVMSEGCADWASSWRSILDAVSSTRSPILPAHVQVVVGK